MKRATGLLFLLFLTLPVELNGSSDRWSDGGVWHSWMSNGRPAATKQPTRMVAWVLRSWQRATLTTSGRRRDDEQRRRCVAMNWAVGSDGLVSLWLGVRRLLGSSSSDGLKRWDSRPTLPLCLTQYLWRGAQRRYAVQEIVGAWPRSSDRAGREHRGNLTM